MSITRPTALQLTFSSQNTGDHVLDQYIEDAERGGLTLAELMEKIFDVNGDPNADAFQELMGLELRVNTTTGQLTFGYSTNPGQDDPTGAYIFRFRGAWAPTTAYKRLDLIVQNGVTYLATQDFSSPASFDQVNLHPITTGLAGTVFADATDNAAGTLDTKLVILGGTLTVIDDGGTRKVQISIQETVDQLTAQVNAVKPRTKILFMEYAL